MSSRSNTPRQKYAGFDQEQEVDNDDYYDDDGNFGGEEYPDDGDEGDGDGDGDEGEGDGDGDGDGDDNMNDDAADADATETPAAATPADTADATDNADSTLNAPSTPTADLPVKRGRGRPRGRPRGSGRGASTPRGAPAGRPRGRGRGRGRAAARNKDRAKGVGRFGNRRRDEDGTEEINFGFIPPEKPAPRILRSIGGNDYWYTEDELEIDDDVRGDQKIDIHGNLLGGRSYKMPTFTSSLRHDREKVYMLSIDAARGAGYKDSLYMFRRNLLLVKLTLEPEEKERLILENKLAANSRSRSVTIVAARNVFKLFGAKVLVNGRHVQDDYYEDKARRFCSDRRIEPGTICTVEEEGQFDDMDLIAAGLANPGPNFGTKFLSRAVGGWATDIGAALFSPATTYATKRTLLGHNITPENWMAVFAREVQTMNVEIAYLKRLRMEEAHGMLVRAEGVGVKKNKKQGKKEGEEGVSGSGSGSGSAMEGVEMSTGTASVAAPSPLAQDVGTTTPGTPASSSLNAPHTSQSQPPVSYRPRAPPPSKKKKDRLVIPVDPKYQDVMARDLGRLDLYTNTPHRSVTHQSTTAHWEKVSAGPEVEGLDRHKQYIGGSKLGTQGFSLASISWELDGSTLRSEVDRRENVSSRAVNPSVLDLDVTY
ncbi:hypothetical protein E3P99_02613 [Wallemia hederae]|uniref:Chromatin structure-remodeling complex protein RSC7 n=1 Tax=Wallemia hederae TaxID=1540922 RepID=A0A4T0FJP4_9BASI|nr:hypothetical protein E3P99_02613 [Wallemia hederae]